MKGQRSPRSHGGRLMLRLKGLGFWEVVEADEEVVVAAAVAMEGGGASEEKRRSRKNRMEEDEGSGKISRVGLGRPRNPGSEVFDLGPWTIELFWSKALLADSLRRICSPRFAWLVVHGLSSKKNAKNMAFFQHDLKREMVVWYHRFARAQQVERYWSCATDKLASCWFSPSC